MLLALTSCQCDSQDDPVEQTKEALRPLEEVGVPREIQAEIHPVIGANAPLPVALVLGSSPETCITVRENYRKRAHVLCRLGSGQEPMGAEDEAALLRALAFFKRHYAAYLDGRPAHLIADPGAAQLGWKMLLADPAVFAFAYLPGLDADSLNPTTVYALQTKGSELLIVDLPGSQRLQLLTQVARRGGLDLVQVQPGPPGRAEGLRRLLESDPRLSPAALKP